MQIDTMNVDVYLFKKKQTHGNVLQLYIADLCSKALLKLTDTDLVVIHFDMSVID